MVYIVIFVISLTLFTQNSLAVDPEALNMGVLDRLSLTSEELAQRAADLRAESERLEQEGDHARAAEIAAQARLIIEQQELSTQELQLMNELSTIERLETGIAEQETRIRINEEDMATYAAEEQACVDSGDTACAANARNQYNNLSSEISTGRSDLQMFRTHLQMARDNADRTTEIVNTLQGQIINTQREIFEASDRREEAERRRHEVEEDTVRTVRQREQVDEVAEQLQPEASPTPMAQSPDVGSGGGGQPYFTPVSPNEGGLTQEAGVLDQTPQDNARTTPAIIGSNTVRPDGPDFVADAGGNTDEGDPLAPSFEGGPVSTSPNATGEGAPTGSSRNPASTMTAAGTMDQGTLGPNGNRGPGSSIGDQPLPTPDKIISGQVHGFSVNVNDRRGRNRKGRSRGGRGIASIRESGGIQDRPARERSVMSQFKRLMRERGYYQSRGIASTTPNSIFGDRNSLIFYSMCMHYKFYEMKNKINLGESRCPKP